MLLEFVHECGNSRGGIDIFPGHQNDAPGQRWLDLGPAEGTQGVALAGYAPGGDHVRQESAAQSRFDHFPDRFHVVCGNNDFDIHSQHGQIISNYLPGRVFRGQGGEGLPAQFVGFDTLSPVEGAAFAADQGNVLFNNGFQA